MSETDNKWFDIYQIETYNDKDVKKGMTVQEIKNLKKKLVVLHQCGDDKEALISQLKTMIHGLETDFLSYNF